VVTFTVVYDNNAFDPALTTSWGFACWIERNDANVLLDTGGDSPTLLGNVEALGLDPQALDAVVLSHVHNDHTGGLEGLLDTGADPTVYAPASFPASFREGVSRRTELVSVTSPRDVLPGFHTTGEVEGQITEQALVMETGEGLVVVTGCAHPGVVEMVRRAQEAYGDRIALVMGGFHLKDSRRSEIERTIEELQALGVERVGPSHCTGDLARMMFADAFGDGYVDIGAGRIVTIGGD
jgi:7,8-dihydropterin-6-yl-methyl-4-(beta-D-ribofuranosyl)aminobenzene 5'-phosphate synthase